MLAAETRPQGPFLARHTGKKRGPPLRLLICSKKSEGHGRLQKHQAESQGIVPHSRRRYSRWSIKHARYLRTVAQVQGQRSGHGCRVGTVRKPMFNWPDKGKADEYKAADKQWRDLQREKDRIVSRPCS